jgi:hypothetical protein
LKANLEQTKQIVETGAEVQIHNLTREKLFGDMFVTGIQGYYTQYIAQSKVMSLKSRTMHQPIPTAGTFGYEPHQRTLFGLNRGIEAHGMYMNVRTAQAIQDRHGDGSKAKQLMLQVGMLSSALEHQVPEQMFTDPNSATKPEGISTAKALSMALAQGQKIYTINQQNRTTALSALRLDSLAMAEINSALASGKEVTAHTDQLTVQGFRGSGYAITDPVTGEGVYKISGGKNGAFIEWLKENWKGAAAIGLFVLGLIASAKGAIAAAVVIFLLAASIAAILYYEVYLLALEKAQCHAAIGCIQNMVLVIAVAALAMAGAGASAGMGYGNAGGLIAAILAVVFGDKAAGEAASYCNRMCEREIE